MPRPELVYHDFRDEADYERCRRARDAAPVRRIELDLRLTEGGLRSPISGFDVARIFRFARDERFLLFIHLVDESVYTDRSLAELRSRLEGEGALREGTIIGSTHLAGLLRVKGSLPEVRNQGRFPVPGILYLHKFGPDLLSVLAAEPARFSSTASAIEALFDVALPEARRSEYEALRLIASFDAIDKRTGQPLPIERYRDGAQRLAETAVLDLFITNGLKREESLRELARLPFREVRSIEKA